METETKKKIWIIGGIISFILIALIINASNISKIKKEQNAEVASLEEQLEKKNELIKEKDSKISELNEKVELAKPWFELAEKEKQAKIEEEKAKEEAERLAAEKQAQEEADKKAAEEAEAKKRAEAEEKKGYETGITYNQIARNPDDHEGDKVKFRGKVVQVLEGDGETQIRIAVNSNYDTVLYGTYDSSIVDSRILEDDIITVMGLSAGLLTYESTMGGKITIPSMLIFQIDQ
ncbi:toxin regulator [Sporosarcina sp. G11-34]|uniref:toxin regulator n=1 Tax=Sporosarcina sp. G11-34 TaxID=2849605 RepID=UPI0022A8ED09|nr:toxin regulator [Sporosarcina sp. G11-34]MCZ2257340.1 toxin regulator [Sporosarcina sp. G11-34]